MHCATAHLLQGLDAWLGGTRGKHFAQRRQRPRTRVNFVGRASDASSCCIVVVMSHARAQLYLRI
jgi:hypothetical protein